MVHKRIMRLVFGGRWEALWQESVQQLEGVISSAMSLHLVALTFGLLNSEGVVIWFRWCRHLQRVDGVAALKPTASIDTLDCLLRDDALTRKYAFYRPRAVKLFYEFQTTHSKVRRDTWVKRYLESIPCMAGYKTESLYIRKIEPFRISWRQKTLEAFFGSQKICVAESDGNLWIWWLIYF